MIGNTLAGKGVPAVFDFFMVQARPTKVERVFVDARLGVWTPEVYACLQIRAA